MCSITVMYICYTDLKKVSWIKAFLLFSELIVIFLGTIRMMRMRRRSRTCEYLSSFLSCVWPWLIWFKASNSINWHKVCLWKTFVPKGPWIVCCYSLSPHLFVSSFNNSCLEHLLDNGADPSMVNSKGYSAVHYAAYHGNKQNLELVSFFVCF